LLARVRARLRDSRNGARMKREANGLVLNLRTHRAHVGDREVDLSAREFLLAETLLRHANQLLSREQLLSSVWGYSFDPGSNVVDVYVGYLRRKLGQNLIQTVRGVGYRLIDDGDSHIRG
jgi:DNA-binding response OmpR family regulator